jgi:ribosomal protein S18 acetylase RimI-like enzyme
MTADYNAVVQDKDAWVAELGGTLVGLLVLDLRDDHVLLENVAVAPAVQNLGIGGLLLDVADERARAAGLPEVRLYTNVAMTENIAYYTRRGYHETGRATQDGFRRIYFAKPVSR